MEQIIYFFNSLCTPHICLSCVELIRHSLCNGIENQPWIDSLTCHLHICDEPGACPVPSGFAASYELLPSLSPKIGLLGRPHCLMQCPYYHCLPPKLKVLWSKELFSHTGSASTHFPVEIQKYWLLSGKNSKFQNIWLFDYLYLSSHHIYSKLNMPLLALERYYL